MCCVVHSPLPATLPPSALLGAHRLGVIVEPFCGPSPAGCHYTLIASRCLPSPLSSMVGCCILCLLRCPPPAFAIARHATPNSCMGARTCVNLESAIVPPPSLHHHRRRHLLCDCCRRANTLTPTTTTMTTTTSTTATATTKDRRCDPRSRGEGVLDWLA